MTLRAIWQFMDWDVAHKILYGPKRSWGPYTICGWQTGRLTAIWPEVPWTICYIILNTCKSVRRHVSVIVYLRQKTSSDKIRKKTLYWSGQVNILKYWPAALTKTNRKNKTIKYNITIYYSNQITFVQMENINWQFM
jgi:hypothetical protein